MRAPVAASVLAAICAASPLAAGVPPARTFLGAADASAGVRVGAHAIAVADDEDDVLRLYDDRGGAPRATVDVADLLGLQPGSESDIEAAARVGDRVYWITSHGPDRRGRLRPERQRFFATTIVGTESDRTLRPFGRPCTTLRDALARAVGAEFPQADPDALEIEGLAATADGRGLWLGLRAPLVDREGRRAALLVPLTNPEAVVERGAAPDLGRPVTVDLDGRAPRDLLWDAERRALLILAVGDDGDGSWGVLAWSTRPGEPAVPLPADPTAARGCPRVTPEALIDGEGDALLVLSDDGELEIPVAGPGMCAVDHYRSDGTCPNKRLADPARRTFCGFELPVRSRP